MLSCDEKDKRDTKFYIFENSIKTVILSDNTKSLLLW